MTTFDEDESGLDTGQPIELFRFSGAVTSYTYTSGNRQMSFRSPYASISETYKPIPFQRTEIVLGDVTEKNELTVSIPKNISLIDDYVFNIAPCDDLNIEIFRQNGPDGDYRMVFYGSVAAFSLQENKATVTCPSLFSNYLGTEFPNIYFQAPCNHILYDGGCGADCEDFKIVGTVLTITSDDRTTITVLEAADQVDQWLTPGEIVTDTERRLIVSHVGATLMINYPFRDLVVGQTVTLYAGCNHTSDHCVNKFDRGDSFLGFEYIPYINPFVTGVK